jgi:MFS family permease
MRAPRTAASIAGRGAVSRLMLPAGADAGALPRLIGRGLRGFCDGFVAVLLPAYLLALGFGQLDVGLVSSATLIGSALATILVGLFAGRYPLHRMLTMAAGLMAATGMGFAGLSALWPLLLVAFVGTLNPSSGDVSLFLPLEQARLAGSAGGDARTAIFARYSLVGAVSAAVGALAAAIPGWLVAHAGWSLLAAPRGLFGVYALVGVALWFLYRRLPEPPAQERSRSVSLGPSRGIVTRLALLFSVDAFAGGLVVNSLLSLWLMQRFGLSLAAAGQFNNRYQRIG